MKNSHWIIFDMDGVIFDSERACLSCWEEIAEEYGMSGIEEVFRRCIGTNHAQTADIVEEAYAAVLGEGIAEKLLRESSRRFHARYDGGNMPVKPGARELLTLLKEHGIPLGLASSTRRASVEKELGESGLLDFFDSITGGDAVKVSKPDPEIYLLAAGALGADPSRTWAIEDSYNGIRSAYAAGLRPVMIPDIIPPDEEMRRLSEVICADPAEAGRYLIGQIFGT